MTTGGDKIKQVDQRLQELAAKPRTRREAVKLGLMLGAAVAVVTTLAPTEARATGAS